MSFSVRARNRARARNQTSPCRTSATLSRRVFLGAIAAAATTGATRRTIAEQDKARYKACVIGDTAQGGYGHSQHMAFSLRPDVAIAGLADPDEKGRAKHAAECGAQHTYADYREMLETERPDLVVIGPRHTVHHKEYLLACAEVGAHGLMEKPLCVDLEEADTMRAAVQQKNLKWALGFNVRATPTVQHVCRMVLEEDLIGTVLDLRGRGKEDHRSGGEDMIVLGAHVFDLMAAVMGGLPQWCFADIMQDGRAARADDVREASEQLGPIVGDAIRAMFGFSSGVTGFFSSAKQPDRAFSRFGLDLYGSRGIVSIRFGAVPQITWLDSPTWAPQPEASAWKPIPGMPDFSMRDAARECYKPIVDDLLNAIETDREPLTSLQHAVYSQEMIQAVFDSHASARRVLLPLENRSHPLRRWSA